MQADFLKNNQEKIFLLLGFIFVFFTGAFSGYSYFQEKDDKNSIIIEDASQDCQDLFKENSVNKYINSNSNSSANSSSQVKGEQNNSDNIILQNKTGMFVASKNSRIYHSPNCQYVKRINEENKIFFKSAEEAKKRGYSPHSCVE
jgi:type II secretory pathway component PulC